MYAYARQAAKQHVRQCRGWENSVRALAHLPLLQEELSHLYLIGQAADSDDTVVAARQGQVYGYACAAVGPDLADPRATLADYGACKL